MIPLPNLTNHKDAICTLTLASEHKNFCTEFNCPILMFFSNDSVEKISEKTCKKKSEIKNETPSLAQPGSQIPTVSSSKWDPHDYILSFSFASATEIIQQLEKTTVVVLVV